MIERKFVSQNMKNFQIQEYIFQSVPKSGISHTRLQLTPLGEKIIIYSERPGLVVGKSGSNIKRLTIALKKKFGLENPQIELSELTNPSIDAQIIADKMATSLERYGSKNFKGTMHKAVMEVMRAGATGLEIVLSGKVPSSRAKSWRVLAGYMKKCGDIAQTQVKKAHASAQLKTGTIGIKVHIMPSDTVLPDRYKVLTHEEQEELNKPEITEITEEKKVESTKKKEEKTSEKPKRKRTVKKVQDKKEELITEEKNKEIPEEKTEE